MTYEDGLSPSVVVVCDELGTFLKGILFLIGGGGIKSRIDERCRLR